MGSLRRKSGRLALLGLGQLGVFGGGGGGTALAAQNAACYDTTGMLIPGYYPCDPTAFITNCCASGWTCFSNSLCVVTTATSAYPNLTLGAVNRAMCTNPHWNNEICGDFCVEPGADASRTADGEMVACGDKRFCCRGDYDAGTCDCTPGSGNFVVNDGAAQTIIGVTASFTGTVSYNTALPTVLSSLATTATLSPSLSPSPTPTPKSKKHKLAIGLGVGLGGGFLLLALLGFAVYFWRHNNGRGVQNNRNIPQGLTLEASAVEQRASVVSASNATFQGMPAAASSDVFWQQNVPPPMSSLEKDPAHG